MDQTLPDLDFNIQLDEIPDQNQQNNVQQANQAPNANNSQNNQQQYVKQDQQQQSLPQQYSEQQQSGGILYDNFNLNKSGHPTYCILTFAFKLAALIFCFIDGITGFILVILSSAFDFWVTKNLTGRKLIGLRYWSDFDENGNVTWVFESPDSTFKPNSIDATFFWTFQIVATCFWGIDLFLKIIGLHFLSVMLYLGTFGLSLVNLIGFYKCRGEHKKKVSDLTKKGLAMIGERLFQNAM